MSLVYSRSQTILCALGGLRGCFHQLAPPPPPPLLPPPNPPNPPPNPPPPPPNPPPLQPPPPPNGPTPLDQPLHGPIPHRRTRRRGPPATRLITRIAMKTRMKNEKDIGVPV